MSEYFAGAHIDPNPNTFHAKYLMDKKLGQRANAQVHLVVRADGDQPSLKAEDARAVKIIDLRFKGNQVAKLVQNEIAVWKKMGHSLHVVHLIEVFTGDSLVYMVMERCSGALCQFLTAIPQLTEKRLGDIFVQMLHGLRHTHKAKVVHRDVKPDNFLVGGQDHCTVKLSDYGLAKEMPPAGKLTGECGTPWFMCPEMVTGMEYDEKADIWSLGVIVYCLLFGRFPYISDTGIAGTEVKTIIAETTQPPSFKCTLELSPAVIAFVMYLLRRNPDVRPTANEAMKMSFITAVQENRHLLYRDPPCLKPMLQAAKDTKAFEHTPHAEKSDVDDLLNRLQMEKHQTPIPRMSTASLVQSDLGHNLKGHRTSGLGRRTSGSTGTSDSANAMDGLPKLTGRGSSVASARSSFYKDSQNLGDGQSECSV